MQSGLHPPNTHRIPAAYPPRHSLPSSVLQISPAFGIFAEKRSIMDAEKRQDYRDGLGGLLPDRDEGPNVDSSASRSDALDSEADAQECRLSAAALARMKSRERRALESARRKEGAEAAARAERIRENISELEAVESSPEARDYLSGGFSDLSPYAGTTKREVAMLLSSLNVNLSLSLTQQDTYNLLGCLLTCNEAQLEALYDNSRVPLAIKTVIKRLMDDAKLGNIETVERLWDRVFGKAPAVSLSVPAAESAVPGIIPGQVVSRQALLVIKDAIYGK